MSGPRVLAATVPPDGDRLAVRGRDGTVRFWDASSGRPSSGAIPAVPGAVDALQLQTATGTLVVSGDDGSVRLVDLSTAKPVGTGPGLPIGTEVLAVPDPARPRLVLLPAASTASVWNLDRPLRFAGADRRPQQFRNSPAPVSERHRASGRADRPERAAPTKGRST